MKKVFRFLLKFINVKPMLKELVDIHLEKAVMDAIAKSDTKVDDMVVPVVYQALEKEALARIDALDFEKMLSE